MARYHVNDEGNVGKCKARNRCPFGDLERDHYSHPDQARRAYERQQDSKIRGPRTSDYREALRSLFVEQGVPVQINERERERWPDSPTFWVSTYGWKNHGADMHFRGVSEETAAHYGIAATKACRRIVPEGVTLTETSYSEFQDTDADNRDVIGINVSGGPQGSVTEIRCACGEFRAMTLRVEGSLSEILNSILRQSISTL